MMGSDVLTIPARSQTLLGMQVAAMVSPDVRVTESGSVLGTLPFVEGFKGFNEKKPEEQQGNYFPLVLTQTGQKMTLKKNGTAAKDKQNMKFDPEIILRVDSPENYYEIEVDGKPVVKLDFKNAVLLGKENE